MAWSLAKLERLRFYARQGQTLNQLASRTNNTPSEVDRALWALLGRSEEQALEHLMTLPRQNIEWDDAQTAKLIELVNAGHSNRSAAKLLGTTPGSISGKMRRIGLTSKSRGAAKTKHARSQAQKAKDSGAPAGPGQANYNGHRPQAKFVLLEADYMDMRRSGVDHEPAARRLKLTPSAAEKFRTYWKAETNAPTLEGVYPVFAHHDEHVAAVMGLGGFPRLSERRGARGHIAVCLPMLRAA